MKLSETESRTRFVGAPSAVLATADGAGRPHIVPVTFVAIAEHLYIAVDDKPKTTTNLRRLRNITENPQVSLLVDHYDEDWERLWWVRADGVARIAGFEELDVRLPERFAERYARYATRTPPGPVIDVDVQRWSGWSSGDLPRRP